MGALNMVVAADLASMLLQFYVRSAAMSQTTKKKPLLGYLDSKKETFPGGLQYISTAIQGQYMSDTPGFFAGYNEDQLLQFMQAQNALRCQYPWKEVHAGLEITWTELKKDAITVNDSMKTSDHSKADLVRLTSVLKNRLADFGESWARSKNYMLWKDGTQDALQVPGIQSILFGANTNVGTTGGVSRATYPFWQNRGILNIVPSGAGQTLTSTLRNEVRQLKVFGGEPTKAFCGSAFCEALELEMLAKGTYTLSGFNKKEAMDFGMMEASVPGIGTFSFDPTLDELGLSKYCYVIDGRRLKLRPMEGEENKVLKPERPYNVAVFLQSMTWTGGVENTQLNACGVYSVA